MAEKSFWSFLGGGDPLAEAQRLRQSGDREKALKLYLKAGDWQTAGLVALEAGKSQDAVKIFLNGALGKDSADAYTGANLIEAAELLATARHIEQALLLLEFTGHHKQAAAIALKTRQPARAAVSFERAREWGQAAKCYEQVGKWVEALRVVDAELKHLQGQPPSPMVDQARREVERRRADLLVKSGRRQDAVSQMKAGGDVHRAARMLEKEGSYREAIEAFLDAKEPAEALRLLAQVRLDPKVAAALYRRAGQPAQAARLLIPVAPQEAAALYEEAGDPESAGRVWQSVGDLARAAQAYFKAGRYLEAGRAFEANRQLLQAADAFSRAGDDNAAAFAYLRGGKFLESATYFLKAGDRAAALQALEKVPEGNPEWLKASLTLLPLLVEANHFPAAIDRLRRLPATLDGAAGLERLYWQARVLEGLDQKVDARRSYQQLLAAQAQFRDAAARFAALQEPQTAAGPVATVHIITHGQNAEVAGGDATVVLGKPAATQGGASVPQGPARLDSLEIGSLLANRYDIQAELGRGGMGRVYRAHDRELDETVAIKTVLRADGEHASEDEERLVREVQICRRITHPNVVRVYDLGRVPGGIFITMEYLDGARLEDLMSAKRQVTLERVRSIVSEIAAGLKEAHALGVVHRDLKPSNIVLTARHLKILDFGIARMDTMDVRLTRTGMAVGSPLYMSPEQVQGTPLDGRSDLYALGVLTFTLLAGREPFLGTSATAVMLEHLKSPPPDLRALRPDLAEPWCDLVHRLLAKNPNHRPANADEVLATLAGLPV